MNRRELLRHLREHGCVLVREGDRRSWWLNPAQNKRPSVPRHSEIVDQLARKICRDLWYPVHAMSRESSARSCLSQSHVWQGHRAAPQIPPAGSTPPPASPRIRPCSD